MNNCLVTKLKETISNDSLIKVGRMRVKISNAAGENKPVIYFNAALPEEERYVQIVGNATFDGGLKTKPLELITTNIYGLSYASYPDGSYELDIPKYFIRTLRPNNEYGTVVFMEYKIEDLSYTPYLVSLSGESQKVTGSLATFKNTYVGSRGFSEFRLYGTTITGSLSDVADIFALSNPLENLNYMDNGLITGSVKELLDSLASVSSNGRTISMNALINSTIDKSNVDWIEYTTNVYVFDGQGGWSKNV